MQRPRPYPPRATSDSNAVLAYRKRSPRFQFNWHYHEHCELTMILRGSGHRFVGDHIGHYAADDLVLLGSRLPHTWRSHATDKPPRSGASEAVVIQFDPQCAGETFWQLRECAKVAALLRRARFGIRFSRETAVRFQPDLLHLTQAKSMDRLLGVLRLLNQLAAEDGEKLSDVAMGEVSLNRSDQRLIDRACRLVLNQYTADLPQAEVAGELGMSPSRFSKFFTRSTGKTFSDYLTALRLSHACRLLIETDRPITDVCLQSGFRNLSNFNRRFKQAYQLSPRAYRRAERAV